MASDPENNSAMFSDEEVGGIISKCPAEVVLRLLLYRGTKTRDIKCKVDFFTAEKNLDGNSLFNIERIIVPDGRLEIETPERMVRNIKWAKVIHLDANNQPVNKGLIIELKTPEDISRPDAAAERLRKLGFHNRPVLTEKTDDDLEGQTYLDFFLALASFLRSARDPKDIDSLKPSSWRSLDIDEYWGYDYREYNLPDPEFEGEPPEKDDVFRLNLLRGDGCLDGGVHVRMESHVIPETEILNGTLEVKVPRRLAPGMKRARLYHLDERGKFDGRGLSLILETVDAEQAPAAAGRLRAMGFHRAALPASALAGQSYLDFFMAWAFWSRSGSEDEAKLGDLTEMSILDRDDYWRYEPRKYELPEAEFEGESPEKDDVFRLRLLRGEDGLDGAAHVRMGSHVIPDAEIQGGTMEIRVPRRLAPGMKRARLYHLDERGKFDGRGLSLILETVDAEQAPAAAGRLRAMGFHRAALPASALAGQSYLDFFMAWAFWSRSGSEDEAKLGDLADLAPLDRDDYWRYEPVRHQLPDPDFTGHPDRYTPINFQLKQTIKKGIYETVTDYNLMSKVEIEDSADAISVNVPSRLASEINQVRIYGVEGYECITADRI